MYYSTLPIEQQTKYKLRLRLIGQLSNLFSSSNIPYLYYRVAEKIYCDSFVAEDLSRGDVSSDAVLEIAGKRIGVGLKTFLMNNNKTFQKIAEFNRQREDYCDLPPLEMLKKVAELRNNRVLFTARAYQLDLAIYHCVIRDEGKFKIFEEIMSLIEIDKIKIISSNKNSYIFTDGIHEYNFNLSKSTLLKRFKTEGTIASFSVAILDDPFSFLEGKQDAEQLNYIDPNKCRNTDIVDTVYLPLYGRNQVVGERSALNQWNAQGRKRDPNEVYINIPIKIHQLKPDFFPPRDASFDLILPGKKVLKSKVCQAGGKALMSYSNKELGKWILRDVLKMQEGELVTYEKLQSLGIDSIRIDKMFSGVYAINFSYIDSYENFLKLFE